MSGVQWSSERTSLQLLLSLIYSTGKWRKFSTLTYPEITSVSINTNCYRAKITSCVIVLVIITYLKL